MRSGTVIRLRLCPVCETHHLVYDEWIVCEAGGAIIDPQKRETRRLSPQICRVFEILLIRRGRVTGMGSIIEALWDSDSEPDYSENIVHLCFKTLRDAGFKIHNSHGRGWELTSG